MKRYTGSEKSPKGVYLNLSSWEFVQVSEAARVLPGDSKVRYIKVPSGLAMVTGPFAGLVFIIFLPMVGIAGLVGYLGYKLWRGAVNLERNTVRLVSFSWQPGKAYFSPRRRISDAKPVKNKKELDEPEEEIDKRRPGGEN